MAMSVAPCSITHDQVSSSQVFEDLFTKSNSELIDTIHTLKKNYEEQIGVLENRVKDLETIIRDEGEAKVELQKEIDLYKVKEESVLRPLNKTKPSVRDNLKLSSAKITDTKSKEKENPKGRENNGKRPAPDLNSLPKRPRIPTSTSASTPTVPPTTNPTTSTTTSSTTSISTTKPKTGLQHLLKPGQSSTVSVSVLPSLPTSVVPGPPKVSKPVSRINNKPLTGRITTDSTTTTKIPTRVSSNRVLDNPRSQSERKDPKKVPIRPVSLTPKTNGPAGKIVTQKGKPEATKQDSSLERVCPEISAVMVSPIPIETSSTLPHQQQLNSPSITLLEQNDVEARMNPIESETQAEIITQPFETLNTLPVSEQQTEYLPNEKVVTFEEVINKSSEDNPLVTDNLTPSPEQSDSLDKVDFNGTTEDFTNESPKKMEVILLNSLDSQPNLNETLSEISTSVDPWDISIEKFSKHIPPVQPENMTSLPESKESISENTSLLQASPVPIPAAISASSPSLFMTPSPLSFGEENLFKMEFKNSVLDFLLPSPVISSPSENHKTQIEAPLPIQIDAPLPMEEDLITDEI